MRPNIFGPQVTALDRFHCEKLQSTTKVGLVLSLSQLQILRIKISCAKLDHVFKVLLNLPYKESGQLEAIIMLAIIILSSTYVVECSVSMQLIASWHL